MQFFARSCITLASPNMKKLNAPTISFSDAILEVVSGIGNEAERNRYTQAIPNAEPIEADYLLRARASTLFELPRVTATHACRDPHVWNGLSKSDLTKLYSQYFVPREKPGRVIYDAIKVGAQGKCPFCGGIGQVRTLDHYLPKSNFPLVSVLPANLIPSCGDCNFDKSNRFPHQGHEQTLNPYFDADHFFTQRWIHARVVHSNPPVLEFSVNPPEQWSLEDKARVIAHFEDYGLSERFAIEAAADLPETILTRHTTLSAATPEQFSSHLMEKASNQALPINNWRRVMFYGLAESVWFCSQPHFQF